MADKQHHLQQQRGGLFLTDGGMETTLIFHHGLDLPHFASFVLLDRPEGRARLKAYYEPFLAAARDHHTGFILDTPTWRANADWGARLGYDAAALRAVNIASIAFLRDIRAEWAEISDCIISGAIGPRGDGYQAGAMDAQAARAYHLPQIVAFADAAADMVTAFTISSIDEAIGIAQAAASLAIPCAISFTVETDGHLIGGDSLRTAIETTDRATDATPLYYMINCAHPTHFRHALDGGAWMERLRGIRANASAKSHAELDDSATLDDGDPIDLGQQYRAIRQSHPGIRILGGCCGTDHRHVAAVAAACLAA